jgi:hypothetical protein
MNSIFFYWIIYLCSQNIIIFILNRILNNFIYSLMFLLKYFNLFGILNNMLTFISGILIFKSNNFLKIP